MTDKIEAYTAVLYDAAMERAQDDPDLARADFKSFCNRVLLVMLAPQFAFKPGRDAIQKHYQGIIDAGATSITLELKNMELRGNDGVWAAGNYSVTVKDKPIQGNWFRILKRENGNWKIAMEAFARAGVIDAPPAATGSPPPPAKSK